MPPSLPFMLHELDSSYAFASERYVVSFIVTCSAHEAHSPQEAVARALSITRDEESSSTHWYVYDRETQQMTCIPQQEAEALITEDD